MLDTTDTPLQSLIRRRKPGFSLEAPFYTSPEVFQADLDIIFHRHWIFVGVEPDVPEPGDAMSFTIGGTSVFVVRDDDMGLRAFHNVCRHRGAPLIHDYKTTVGNIVCRYHSWTYGLDGKLLFAEHMGADFDPSCHGLKPVHVRSLEGLIFICLSDDPPADFDVMAAQMAPYLAPHDLRNAKVAFEKDIIEPGNWKLTMENNRECYHCAGNHPELTVPLFAYGFGFAPEELDEHERAEAENYAKLVTSSHREWESCGFPSEMLEHLDDMVTGFRTERLPLAGDGESHTGDTKAACTKLLGSINDPRHGALHFWTQPNSWHHFMSDHAVVFSVLPLDAERSLLRTKWLVHKDAVEGVDYDIANLTAVWEATNDQDSELVGYCQHGARSPAYEPGPYSPHTEMLVEKFCNWYVGRMAEHLGR
ncbi:MAG: Rieske (2Fe-2S) iron-sulfur domain protein [Xanthobacteraceae bacterium]|jgi:Rieske 2Fe-2S family protein|nr:Rieske (2Fe-2S) iron-sulfur domain protein [Xanthobacteraceae bacterium]